MCKTIIRKQIITESENGKYQTVINTENGIQVDTYKLKLVDDYGWKKVWRVVK